MTIVPAIADVPAKIPARAKAICDLNIFFIIFSPKL
jgi:hypothetical protein